MEEYRKCPFCAEEIKINATICRYCDSNLTEAESRLKKEKPEVRMNFFGVIFGACILIALAFSIVIANRRFLPFIKTFDPTNTPTLTVTPTITPSRTPRPTATIPPAISFVKVIDNSVTCYSDTIGNLIIEGVVLNKSNGYDLTFVKVSGALLDSSGSQIASGWTFIDSAVLQTGQFSKFKIYVINGGYYAGTCGARVEEASFR